MPPPIPPSGAPCSFLRCYSPLKVLRANGVLSDAQFVAEMASLYGPFLCVYHLPSPTDGGLLGTGNLLQLLSSGGSEAPLFVAAYETGTLPQPVGASLAAQLRGYRASSGINWATVQYEGAAAPAPRGPRKLAAFLVTLSGRGNGIALAPNATLPVWNQEYTCARDAPPELPGVTMRPPPPMTDHEHAEQCRLQHARNVGQKTGILIESRFPPNFVATVQMFFTLLGDDWVIQLFGSEQTLNSAKASKLQVYIAAKRLVLSPLKFAINWAKVGAINQLWTMKEFWSACQVFTLCLGEPCRLSSPNRFVRPRLKPHRDAWDGGLGPRHCGMEQHGRLGAVCGVGAMHMPTCGTHHVHRDRGVGWHAAQTCRLMQDLGVVLQKGVVCLYA